MAAQINSWAAFKHHWLIWYLSGFQLPARGSRWRVPFLCYALLLALLVPFYFPLSFVIASFKADNFTDFFAVFYIAVTDLALNIKFLNLYTVRHKLLQVRPALRYLDARVGNAAEVHALQQGIDSARSCFTYVLRLYWCVFLSSQLVVYFSKEQTLMYNAWFPFNWQASRRNYLMAHGYQTLAYFIQAAQASSVDTYPQAYMRVLAAHVQALSIRLQCIGEAQAAGGRTDAGELSAQQKERNYEELTMCIKDHKTIIELFETIEKPISGTCMVQFVCTGIAQCTIGVYILYVDFSPSIVMNIIMFFTAVTVETLLLCYNGDLFCRECEKLCTAIYSSDWTPQSQRFKQTLLFFLLRAQKANIVMAGNLIPMQLPTFVQVMKTAYSTFTLLSSFR